jgi:lysozyme
MGNSKTYREGEIMLLSEPGIGLLQMLEGCRLEAYQDQAGIWTIGYGETGANIGPGTKWTQSQCEAIFMLRLRKLGDQIAQGLEIDIRDLGDNEQMALVSFTYNVGIHAFATSHLAQLVNHLADGTREEDIAQELTKWDKITIHHELVVDRGLVGRRAVEAALWLLPIDAPPPDWAQIRTAAE